MKKISYFNKAFLQVTFVSAVLLLASCNFEQKPADTKEVAEEHNDAKFDDNKQEKDAQFLVNAAEISLEQIQLGKLAQQSGRTTQVKELGSAMVVRHTKSLAELTALAKSKMITIPTSPTEDAQEAYKSLTEKTGNDFDKEYADLMVSGHKDAVQAFEKASTDSYNVEIKNWASAALPDLRTDLDQSINVQKNSDKLITNN